MCGSCKNSKILKSFSPTTRSRTVTLLRLRSNQPLTNVDCYLFSESKNKHVPNLKQATFQTVTGGLYRAPLQIHRNFADLRLLAIPTLWFQVAETNPISRIFKD